MSTLAYARGRLFEPMGIRLRPWPTDPQGIYFGGNDMRLTPREMLRFGELYRNGGRYNGKQIVPAEWIRESWTPRTPLPLERTAVRLRLVHPRIARAPGLLCLGIRGTVHLCDSGAGAHRGDHIGPECRARPGSHGRDPPAAGRGGSSPQRSGGRNDKPPPPPLHRGVSESRPNECIGVGGVQGELYSMKMPRGRVAAILAALAALAVAAFVILRPAESESASPRGGGGGPDEPAPVETYVARAEPIQDRISATGTLLANEEVELVGETSGRITRVLFREGSPRPRGSAPGQGERRRAAGGSRECPPPPRARRAHAGAAEPSARDGRRESRGVRSHSKRGGCAAR